MMSVPDHSPKPVPRWARRGRQFVSSFLLLACAWLPGFSPAAGQGRLDLPEEAEALWEAGMVGFRQGDWGAAIRNMVQVQKLAPAQPVVLYNLAASYDFSAFRELMAIGWLNAYMAAAPEARNIPQVRLRIDDLEQVATERIVGLFELAREAAEPLKDLADPSDLIAAYDQIARGQARSRVLGPAARLTANQIPSLCLGCGGARSARERTAALLGVFEAELLAGDHEEAFLTAEAIDADLAVRDNAFGELARARAALGAGDLARQAVARIGDAGLRAETSSAIEAALSSGGVDSSPQSGSPAGLQEWLDFMADRSGSLESAAAIFQEDVSGGEPLATVDRLVEAAVIYGQELTRLKRMQGQF